MSKSPIELFYTTLPIINDKRQITGSVARPMIDIILNYKHGKMVGPVQALIDSGADYNLFPEEVASIIGVKLTNGVLRMTEGIGGKTIKAYRHSGIKMFVEGHSFVTSVDFSEEVTVPLLGQQGFFNKFDSVTLLRQKEKIILKP